MAEKAALSETWPAALSIEPDVFEQHLDLLVKRGYVGATFERAITDPPAPRTVAVTFDDAFRSVKEPSHFVDTPGVASGIHS